MPKRKARKPITRPSATQSSIATQAGPRAYAVVEEERAGGVGAYTNVERVAERQLPGESHHHVPCLAGIGKVQDERGDRERIGAGKRGSRTRSVGQGREPDACPAHCFLSSRPAPQEQHEDQQAEAEHALRRRHDEKTRERLGKAHQQAAEQRAGHRSESAHDDDDEGEEGVVGAERRGHIDEEHHRAARDRYACRAKPEGERVVFPDVQAHDLGAEVIIGARADRLAGQREPGKGEQHGCGGHGQKAAYSAALSTRMRPISNDSSG